MYFLHQAAIMTSHSRYWKQIQRLDKYNFCTSTELRYDGDLSYILGSQSAINA